MMQENETVSPRTLNLDALRSFVAICDSGSFRRGAARVCKSPSALSLQIAKLEETLGAKLIERDARRMALTDQGALLLGQARRMLALSDETFALFNAEALSGRLTLTAPHDLGVSLAPRLLRRLAETQPSLRVDVRLAASRAVRAALTEGTAQLALFNDVGASAVPALDLYTEPLVWLTAKGGAAAERRPLPLATAEISCAWRDAALAALDRAGTAYDICYVSDTAMGQVAALRADLAVAALPRSLAGPDLAIADPALALPPLPHTTIRIAGDGGALAKAVIDIARKDLSTESSALRAQP